MDDEVISYQVRSSRFKFDKFSLFSFKVINKQSDRLDKKFTCDGIVRMQHNLIFQLL